MKINSNIDRLMGRRQKKAETRFKLWLWFAFDNSGKISETFTNQKNSFF